MTPQFALICVIIAAQLTATGASVVACMVDFSGYGKDVCTDGRFANSFAACLAVALAIYKGEK